MLSTGHKAAAAPFGRVAMVASLGGMQAFTAILSRLPENFPVPIVVVQHRPRTSRGRDTLAAVLARKTLLPVTVAEVGGSADLHGVTVIPGNTTATISPAGRWVLDVPDHQLPGDALLISSASNVPTIAVILTGHLSDGSRGCRAVKSHGGRVLVQDPSTARALSMPSNAVATGCADFVLPLDRIPTALLALTTAPGAADLLAVTLPPWARLGS